MAVHTCAPRCETLLYLSAVTIRYADSSGINPKTNLLVDDRCNPRSGYRRLSPIRSKLEHRRVEWRCAHPTRLHVPIARTTSAYA